MSRNAIVYQSRNRLTGTLMQTIDMKHPDAAKLTLPTPSKANASKRYVALCVEHKTAVYFDEHYPAGRAIAHPDEWCAKCRALIAKGSKLSEKDKAPTPVFANRWVRPTDRGPVSAPTADAAKVNGAKAPTPAKSKTAASANRKSRAAARKDKVAATGAKMEAALANLPPQTPSQAHDAAFEGDSGVTIHHGPPVEDREPESSAVGDSDGGQS